MAALRVDTDAQVLPRRVTGRGALGRLNHRFAAQEIPVDVPDGVFHGKGPGDQPLLDRKVLQPVAAGAGDAGGSLRLVLDLGREAPHAAAPLRRRRGAGKTARPVAPPTDGPFGRGAETRSPQGQALGRQRRNLRGRGGLLSESRRAVARNDDGEKTRGHDPGSQFASHVQISSRQQCQPEHRSPRRVKSERVIHPLDSTDGVRRGRTSAGPRRRGP